MTKLVPTTHPFSIIRMLHIIGHQTDEIFDAILRTNYGLTLARFRILMPLIELGPQTQASIARFHFLTEASIARQVRLLVADGYLKRTPDQTDGRKFVLMLTKKTEALLPQIKNHVAKEFERLCVDFTPAELEQLSKLLIQLQVAGVTYSGKDEFLCRL